MSDTASATATTPAGLPVTVHDLRTGEHAADPHSVATAVSDTASVHLLVFGGATRATADGAVLQEALARHPGPVAAVAAGPVRGVDLASYASADLRLVTPDASFGWGEEAVVPGLAGTLASRCGWPATVPLTWGETLGPAAATTTGLATGDVADTAAAVAYVTARVAALGVTTLRLRIRSLRAWSAGADLSSSTAYDRHLTTVAASEPDAS